MRYRTSALLSQYLLGRASLETLRAFIEDVDWDDPTIPEDERAVLLGVEARLAGLDENLNDETDIRCFLVDSMSVELDLTPSGAGLVTNYGASNQTQTPMFTITEERVLVPLP